MSRTEISGKISEIEQNDVTNDVIDQKRDMLIKKISTQNLPLVMLNNLAPHKYFVKIKLSCSKRRLGEKINEIDQNLTSKMTS